MHSLSLTESKEYPERKQKIKIAIVENMNREPKNANIIVNMKLPSSTFSEVLNH